MKLYKLIILLTLGLFITSCTPSDDEPPVIVITSPSDGMTVAPGGVFSLVASVVDNEGLSTVSFTDGNTTETITSFDTDLTHNLNYNITIDSTSTTGELTITVNATDLEGNAASEDVTIDIQ